ncbi:hypothetical protein L202_02479 [Cryptococcus amylolentus CBS 6039]|uniref:Uncharacterized protein n=2 Tax=Cryptococcus amylolentus TaxID=104669 RepID=A0A1E3I0S4_9TREE|nr:hypothetical protein L202_02479 [Cryptococcus amylolentus CBS 6039]ODN82189.1 hypothetical protein L202_02479 [Cryptococcus amylolentus CBS 6039]ODO09722.1 hypothetical protein I350_01938 [Cryptococcus amylolentus CBS 6273]
MVDEEVVRACPPELQHCLPDLDRIPEAPPFDTSLPTLKDYLKQNHRALYDVLCRHLEKPPCLDDEDIQVLAVLRGNAPEDEYNRKLIELLETRPCPRTLLEVDYGDPAGDEDEVDVDDRADESGGTFWEGAFYQTYQSLGEERQEQMKMFCQFDVRRQLLEIYVMQHASLHRDEGNQQAQEATDLVPIYVDEVMANLILPA